VLQLLNDSLSSELVCVLRYRLHQVMSASVGGVAGLTVAGEILQHANEELGHADLLAGRIVQLGGRA
jgi:bacterioferritin